MRTSLDAPFLLRLAVSRRFVVAIVVTCQILGIKAMKDFRLSPSAGFNTPSPVRVPGITRWQLTARVSLVEGLNPTSHDTSMTIGSQHLCKFHPKAA